ncbi:Protein MON2-like protein [Erysiphe neolycopersici]|uniref:Protein MON2-like protein n=1 Tax=Erysiphe neolycopersici TaxID=212602 RepID=A0A420HG76_9PEZI|nr:Protein MON2-like protein [Erysiphe neolycopersici]
MKLLSKVKTRVELLNITSKFVDIATRHGVMAAEKSLGEVKSLRQASEAQVAADLSQRHNFVTPFIIACGTKNVKLTGIAIICLQRLAVSRALSRVRLKEVLEAFREASSAGLDVQLKILQALPFLLQNYAEELRGELVATTLNICTVLQSSKNSVVTNTAAATLQQLVVTVFDNVVAEDKSGQGVPTVGEVVTEDGLIQLRPAALDAYKIFNDLCLLTDILSSEAEMALSLLTYMLDHDTASWKRSLCMEVLRGLFSDAGLIRRVFNMYDSQEGRKPILRDLVAAFVRVSAEKPSVIGLGPQSSVPWANQGSNVENDQAILEASGVPGIIGSSISTIDPDVGISTQWSTMRVPCIDQLDKIEPPSIPVSYIYSLTLACINGFSEGLARFILPLTAPEKSSQRSKLYQVKPTEHELSSGMNELNSKLKRQTSTKKNPSSINPLTLESHPLLEEIKACAGIIENCWPAILATCSTFLYAALDAEYFRGLVRSFQKFTHVAGLLHLSTPRDAFLTTLSKAAVPSNLLASNIPTSPPIPTTTSSFETQSMFHNAKGLLSGESSSSDKVRKSTSADSAVALLNTRNLLCLRALLNLGIALGPTLDSGWAIILGTLQHAELVRFSSSKSRTNTTNQKAYDQADTEDPTLLANFGVELKAVETAANRLLEGTVELSNTYFLGVVNALCSLFGKEISSVQDKQKLQPTPDLRRKSYSHARATSIITSPIIQSQEDLFVLSKLRDIASINIDRLISYPADVSGWDLIASELTTVAYSSASSTSVRLKAAEILTKIILEAASAASLLTESECMNVQLRLLDTLRQALQPLEFDNRDMSVAAHAADIDVHKIFLESLKSFLENCGNKFVNGWDVVFSIIGSVFINKDIQVNQNLKESKETITRSGKIIRSAFNSLQLICSDFLSSLPDNCFIILIDTLFKFCSQNDDLNISLTTVTFFWDISDFISGKADSFSLGSDLIQASKHQSLIEIVRSNDLTISEAALWMLLLLRLAAVTTDNRLELRKSAIQTLLRILDAFGDQLSPEAWSMCLESIIFKLLLSIIERLNLNKFVELSHSVVDKEGWHETTVLILTGLTNLLADYLDVISKSTSFKKAWRTLIDYFDILLQFKVLSIDTAIFKALRKTAIQYADAETYSLDVDHLTSLQMQVLDILKIVRTDIRGVPAALMTQVAEFAELAFKPRDMTGSKIRRPTYVALSKASMIVLESLIVTHFSDLNIYSSRAVSAALEALAKPIKLKYSFSVTTKTTASWQQATTCALSILNSIVPFIVSTELEDDIVQSLWSSIINISDGIIRVNIQETMETTNIELDEKFDIESFLTLRNLITLALGSTKISDETRRIYAESLFHMSLIHEHISSNFLNPSHEFLSRISYPRKGKTVDPTPSARSKMSYVCFDEIISLVSKHDSSEARIKLAQAAAPYLILRACLTIQAYIVDQPLRGMTPQPLTQRKELLYILRALVNLRCEPEAIQIESVQSIKSVGSSSGEKKHLVKLYPLFVMALRAAVKDQEVLSCLTMALDRVQKDFGVS